MINPNKIRPLKIYKVECFLPTLETDKKHGSVITMLSPSYEASKFLMNNPMFVNKKRFESYYLDRDVSFLIGSTKIEEIEESYINEMKRSELPDSAFGIPESRKYPLETEKHVRSAIKLFGHCPDGKRKELAKRIARKAKEYGIEIPQTTQVYKCLHEDDESIITESDDFIIET